jgi:hypothetical protein
MEHCRKEPNNSHNDTQCGDKYINLLQMIDSKVEAHYIISEFMETKGCAGTYNLDEARKKSHKDLIR